MPNGSYQLSAGLDNNNLLNLQIDTFERMNKVQESLNIPDYTPISMPNYEPFIPKEFDGDTILKGDQKLPTLKDSLLSSDPKVRQAAKQIVESQAQKNPVTYGIGTDQYVPYTEGQSKFTNKSFFKGRRQTMFGYNPYISMAENEDFNHEHIWNKYSMFGKTWRGIGMFSARALSKAVTGLVGMVGDLGSMAWNGLEELNEAFGGAKNNFWSDVSNNALSREMEKWDQHVKNQWFPTYKALNYDNKGAWEKLFDPYTWTNSFADGAGFLLQFVVPGVALGKIGQAGRLSRSIGALETELIAANAAGDTAQAAKLTKTIAQAKNVSAFTKAMGYDLKGIPANIAQALTGSENVGGISAHIFNTMLESVAETKEGFNSTVKDLMDKGMTREQAVKIAGENAPAQFWLNTAILSFSNAFENKLLQKAIGNRALTSAEALAASTLPEIEAATTKLGKFFEANKWGSRISFYGKNAAKSSFFEGFWEENAQTAAQRYARGEYERQGDDGGGHEKSADTFIAQLWKQTKDAIKGNDREAADSIMAGSVIGVLGNTVFSKLAGTRGEIVTPEVKDKDGNIIQERQVIKPRTFLPEGQRKTEIREKAQRLSTFINTRDAWLSIKAFDSDVYDNEGNLIDAKVKEKTDLIKEKIAKVNSFVAQNLEAQDLIDPDKRDRLQNKLFASYVKAHILNDTGDALVSRLKDWRNKSEDELSLYGVSAEMAKDSQKWAAKADSLVKAYKDIKDIRYAAPANTSLSEYQNNTSAIHSIIFDYTAYRDMSQDLSAQYEELMSQGNPFADHPMLQEYNENQVKLIKLKQKLQNEDLSVIDRENIQKQIDNLEKAQAERKKSLSTLNETREDKNGIVIPKEADAQKEAERVAEYQEYFDFLSNKIDHDINAETYDKLIKEYSDPKTGYKKYLDALAHWDKVYNKSADEQVNADVADEIKKTKEVLEKEITDLQNTLQNALTKEERDAINLEIEKRKNQIADINEDLDNNDVDTDTTTDDDVDNTPPPPPDKQYGTDDYIDQALAYVTPFKTVNKETIDAKDKETEERIWWKEIAIEHSYDHDLTTFAKQFQNEVQTSPDKYEMFVIKDTLDLMKERLSPKQLESFDENKFKIGAIVVFRERGKQEWVKFKNGKTIAFSYNERAFESNFDERVRINSERTRRSIPEVLEFFRKQQLILEAIREKVIAENVQIPIKSETGSLGVFPVTTAGNALERFKGFYDVHNPIIVVKTDNKNLVPDSVEGQVYLNIPEVSTVNKRQYYIPVYTSTLQKGEQGSLQEKIYNSIQAIQLSTFKSKKEASDIIRNYLFNFFYISDANNFKIREVQGGFKIVYKDAKAEHTNWLNIPRLKLSDKLYNTEEGFSLYEKKDNIFQPTSKITKTEYRQFIHNHLITRRKVVVQYIKNVGERLYTLPVNAYLNLQTLDETDVQIGASTQTTEQAVTQPALITIQTYEDKKADIEKRRQEELQDLDAIDDSLSIREINDKYDTELAALEKENSFTEQEQKAIEGILKKKAEFKILKVFTDVIKNPDAFIQDKKFALKEISGQMLAPATAEKVGKELGKTIGKLIDDLGYPAPIENEALKDITKVAEAPQTEESIEDQLVNLKEQLSKAEQGSMSVLVRLLTAKIKDLEKQLENSKPKENMSPVENLRAVANQSLDQSQISSIVPHTFEGNSFKIDFDNDTVEGYFEDVDKDYAKDFFDSFPVTVFTKSSTENNNISYYFVKHNRLGKFVTFDQNMRFYKVSELPQEIKDSIELKNMENCN